MVHGLENGETLADGGYADLLEGVGVQDGEDITRNMMFYVALSECFRVPSMHRTSQLGLVLRESEACKPEVHV